MPTTSPLPLSTSKATLPYVTQDQIEKIKALVGPDSVEYFQERLDGIIDTYKNKKDYEELQEHVNNYVQLVTLQGKRPSAWGLTSPDEVKDDPETFQDNYAQSVIDTIVRETNASAEAPVTLHFGFAVTDGSQVLVAQPEKGAEELGLY